MSKSQDAIKKNRDKHKFRFFNFPKDLIKKDFDYSRIVESNDVGISAAGQKKLTKFFLEEPLEVSIARRKIISFILLQQKMTDKHRKITMDSLCKFTGLSMKDLQHELYVLYRKVQLLKGDRESYHEYRIPKYLYINDILKVIKKKQDAALRKIGCYKKDKF